MKDDNLVEQLLKSNYEALGSRRQVMLEHVTLLTRTPWKIAKTDIEALRAVGFCDSAILAITETAGYYAYVNRIASGLGVELEEE